MEENDLYLTLSKQLENYPVGFPKTETGVELEILKNLFSVQEANH